MEDFIGWVILLLIPVAFIFGFFKVRNYIERKNQLKYEAEQTRAEALAKQRRERYRQVIKSGYENKAREQARKKPGYYYPATSSRSTTTDDGPDLLTTMILMDVMNSPSGTVAGTVSWKDDTPTITPKTNWDREESYSSTSSSSSSSDDSPSKSSSWSSSSSDSSSSWSSSDSGSSSSWD